MPTKWSDMKYYREELWRDIYIPVLEDMVPGATGGGHSRDHGLSDSCEQSFH